MFNFVIAGACAIKLVGVEAIAFDVDSRAGNCSYQSSMTLLLNVFDLALELL